MDLNEANSLWFESKPIAGVKFGLNEDVCIVRGKNAGNHASVISLMSLAPVTYLVELDTGEDVIITESEIEKAD